MHMHKWCHDQEFHRISSFELEYRFHDIEKQNVKEAFHVIFTLCATEKFAMTSKGIKNVYMPVLIISSQEIPTSK